MGPQPGFEHMVAQWSILLLDLRFVKINERTLVSLYGIPVYTRQCKVVLLLLLLLLSIRHTNQGVVVQIRERNTEVWLRQKTNHKKLS